MADEMVGYIVLTPTTIRGKKGAVERIDWQPDWDGLLHTDRNEAFAQLKEAMTSVGEVVLVRCITEYRVILDGDSEATETLLASARDD